jgi:hypothetical protein
MSFPLIKLTLAAASLALGLNIATTVAEAAPTASRPTIDRNLTKVGYDYESKSRRSGRTVVVDAPGTHVDQRRGRVVVDAPYTFVDRSSRGVRVRAPFVDLYVRR